MTTPKIDTSNLPAGAHLDGWGVGAGHLYVGDVRDYAYRVGTITTHHGNVGFYDQAKSPHTRLDIVFAGRVYVASWDRTFTDRFLKTLAKRFAASVARLIAQGVS